MPRQRTKPVTKSIRPVLRGRTIYLPINKKLARRLKIQPRHRLYWTVVDGVLQLSADAPVMVISVLDRPEEKFGVQRG